MKRGLFLVWFLFFTTLYGITLSQKYPSYKYVLQEFDIDTNYINEPEFVRFVTNNEDKYRSFYKNSLKRGKAYIPMFKDLLVSGGLSHLFVYMSMTESGFQTYAKSSKQAAGLWQFMSATAKRFNLRVDEHIDQRYDPIASTEAAMKYIQTLYRMFGKWYLVMMAYNCGEGRLQKAIKMARSDDFVTLMSEDKKYLPLETRRYLQKIILLSMMGERIRTSTKKEEKKIKEEILPSTEILVNVYGGITLQQIANMIDVNVGELYRLNPQIKGGKIPNSVSMTQIFIPAKKLERFKAFYRPPTLQEIFKKRGYSKLVAHIVKKQDTLKEIARNYHSTVLDIIIANELPNEYLKLGQVIMVPVSNRVYEERLTY